MRNEQVQLSRNVCVKRDAARPNSSLPFPQKKKAKSNGNVKKRDRHISGAPLPAFEHSVNDYFGTWRQRHKKMKWSAQNSFDITRRSISCGDVRLAARKA